MTWVITWSPKSIKQMRKLPKTDSKRIANKVEELKKEPLLYLKKLTKKGQFRLRVGNYRVVMILTNNKLLIEIVTVVKRSRVYD